MKNKTAITKNVKKLLVAAGSLQDRSENVEGMSLVSGNAGTGKSWASTFAAIKVEGCFVRAKSIWRPVSMLADISSELGGEPTNRTQPMFNFIIGKLMETGRALFIDEADYMKDDKFGLLDLVRDIYDSSRAPVFLIGEENLKNNLSKNARFIRRITQEVDFTAIDMEDARTVTNTVCEVTVADDLLERLHGEAKGEIGLIANGLDAIESWAKTNGKDGADSAIWANRKLFFKGSR
ncbi:MAG: ATP-binding protein [Desulfobacteraceae bacterium]|nr:ATP-binding protein [Desulfobacteraceae bacterium]